MNKKFFPFIFFLCWCSPTYAFIDAVAVETAAFVLLSFCIALGIVIFTPSVFRKK